MAAGSCETHARDSLLELRADGPDGVPVHVLQRFLFLGRHVTILKHGIGMRFEGISKRRVSNGPTNNALYGFQCRSSHLPSFSVVVAGGRVSLQPLLGLARPAPDADEMPARIWRAMRNSANNSAMGG